MAIELCPKCGKKVSDTRNDCPHCGYILWESDVCPECGANVVSKYSSCPECGYKIFEPVEELYYKQPDSPVQEEQLYKQPDTTVAEVKATDPAPKKPKSGKNAQSNKIIRIAAICIASLFIGLGLGFGLVFNSDSKYFEYINIGDHVYITGYSGTSKNLEIPRKINGKMVTAIAANAFENRSDLVSIKISNSVNHIFEAAFNGCSSLESIEIGENVTYIASDAFNGCSSLESIVIGKNITYIGSNAFSGCESLRAVTFEDTQYWHCALHYIEVDDPITNAVNLILTYAAYNWAKK